ncbi:MAG: hypothetical protein K5876_02185 [Ruminiclostridium sp.]|nr:hypothetical protein [Ruminiclostridium sp.]
MEHILLLYAAMTLSSAGSFAYGAVKYLKPHKPLYASMIVLGIGCIMIGRAYSFLRILTGLPVTGIFHVGILGIVGAFAFFFSANFGQIDSLVDGGEKDLSKYRIAGLAGVIVTLVLYMFIILSPASTAEKITDSLAAAAVAGASYFHVKHVLIPDVDYGVVKCQRGYNIVALIYGILCMLELVFTANGAETPVFVICVLECIVSAALIPVMHKGVVNWSR